MDTAWFKGRLADLGLITRDVGAALGLDRSVASRILNGQQPLKMNEVAPLAKLLKASPSEILAHVGLWGTAPVQAIPLLSPAEVAKGNRKSGREVFVISEEENLFAMYVNNPDIAPEGALAVVQRGYKPDWLGAFREDGRAVIARNGRRSIGRVIEVRL